MKRHRVVRNNYASRLEMIFFDEKRETDEKYAYIVFFHRFYSFEICLLSFRKFSKVVRGGYEKSTYQKNSPEMNVSERDLFPVKFLSKSVEKQKSSSNVQLPEFFLDFF